MDDLDYEKHLSYYLALFGSESEYAERQAQTAHAFSVFNPLGDWLAKAINIAEQLTQENAKRYMKYGVGRRIDMLAFPTSEFGLCSCGFLVYHL
jgi:hypothetical protein